MRHIQLRGGGKLLFTKLQCACFSKDLTYNLFSCEILTQNLRYFIETDVDHDAWLHKKHQLTALLPVLNTHNRSSKSFSVMVSSMDMPIYWAIYRLNSALTMAQPVTLLQSDFRKRFFKVSFGFETRLSFCSYNRDKYLYLEILWESSMLKNTSEEATVLELK